MYSTLVHTDLAVEKQSADGKAATATFHHSVPPSVTQFSRSTVANSTVTHSTLRHIVSSLHPLSLFSPVKLCAPDGSTCRPHFHIKHNHCTSIKAVDTQGERARYSRLQEGSQVAVWFSSVSWWRMVGGWGWVRRSMTPASERPDEVAHHVFVHSMMRRVNEGEIVERDAHPTAPAQNKHNQPPQTQNTERPGEKRAVAA